MEIILLDKIKYKDFTLIFNYTTDYYYDVEIDKNEIFSIKLVKKPYGKETRKIFTMKLYQEWLEEPSAYLLSKDKKQIGYLEVEKESWSNRLRITELLIFEDYRHLGYGSLLIEKAINIAKTESLREIVLATETCDSKAIDFYLKNGFRVNGIDLSFYSNEDIEKKEVRIEMVLKIKK